MAQLLRISTQTGQEQVRISCPPRHSGLPAEAAPVSLNSTEHFFLLLLLHNMCQGQEYSEGQLASSSLLPGMLTVL